MASSSLCAIRERLNPSGICTIVCLTPHVEYTHIYDVLYECMGPSLPNVNPSMHSESMIVMNSNGCMCTWELGLG